MEIAYKKAALNTSVGADDGQPNTNNCNDSIKDLRELFKRNNNNSDETRIVFSDDPDVLTTRTMEEIYDSYTRSKPALIEGLLYNGVYIFAGAPKLGKSFLMLQLSYHISQGIPLWEFPVKQSNVLYLALEDDYQRIHQRMYKMFGDEPSKNLSIAVMSSSIGKGLENQIIGFIQTHKNTRLVIIDTLQKIRSDKSESSSYAGDYDVMDKLKVLSERTGICLILVHHTRKQFAEDKFDMISGTNGLLGAADGAFIMHKNTRTDNQAILEISGRDQQDQRIVITRNFENLQWDFVSTETELWKAPIDPVLMEVNNLLGQGLKEWIGSPQELVEALKLDIKANSLSYRMNANASTLFNEFGIEYSNKHVHEGRRITLRKVD